MKFTINGRRQRRMNVLKFDKKSAIEVLLDNGITHHEIHRKTKIDRKTIRKYALLHQKQSEEKSKTGTSGELETSAGFDVRSIPGYPARSQGLKETGQERHIIPSEARSACAPHREWIEKQVRLGRNAVSIYQDLVERYNFPNKYNSVKRYVRGLKKKEPDQFDRLDFLPGEEAQVDYGEGARTLHSTGKYRKPRLFVMTLKYSGRSFRKTVWKSSKEMWTRLHEEAFRYFGGCPQYVVLDNLKEGVIKPDIYEPELNPLYASVLEHYGVVADPARVRDPDRKGTVENAIQHTQNTALKGRSFESIEQQNEWLMHWEEHWASQRIHGRSKRQVEEMFQEEKPYLKELPLTSFRYFNQETRTVWDDGNIQVGKSYYSALPAPLYQKVIVRIYKFEIEIIDPRTMEIIRRHIKSPRAGSVQMEEKDRIFNPSRQTEYLLARAGSIGPETGRLCRIIFRQEGRPGQRRMQGIVNMVRHFESRHIEEAAIKALATGIRSYKSIRRLVEEISEQEQAGKKEDTGTLIQEHELIRSPGDYALFWEEHAAGGPLSCESSEGDLTSAAKEGVNMPQKNDFEIGVDADGNEFAVLK
jgi:transposase